MTKNAKELTAEQIARRDGQIAALEKSIGEASLKVINLEDKIFRATGIHEAITRKRYMTEKVELLEFIGSANGRINAILAGNSSFMARSEINEKQRKYQAQYRKRTASVAKEVEKKSAKIDRECLKCERKFLAASNVQRLCERCRRRAEDILDGV